MKGMRRAHAVIALSILTGPMLMAQDSDSDKRNVKLAQSGFQFLSVVSDARGAAMGEAMTTLPTGAASLFFNPAGIAHSTTTIDAAIGSNTWLAGITHNSLAATYNVAGGRFGTLGFSLTNVDYGNVQGTMVARNDQGFIDTEILTPSAFTVGVGYARKLSDRFSVGAHLRNTHQDLSSSVIPVERDGEVGLEVVRNRASVGAVDFGTLYYVGFKSLAFGMSMRNFSKDARFSTENFQLPLTFLMGLSMDLLDLMGEPDHSEWLLSIDVTHPRSFYEQLKIGSEFSLYNTFALRGGYMLHAEEGDLLSTGIHSLTLGFGIHVAAFTVDYAFADSKYMNSVHRYTMRVAL